MKFMIFGIFGVSLMLAGCATLSKAECQTADWRQIGIRDGNQGHDALRLGSHAKACAKVGITPDHEQWEAGRQVGLQSYCTVDNAYRRGRQGQPIKQVCPMQIQDYLNRANNYGNSIYKLQANINNGQKELTNLKDRLKKLQEGDNLEFATEKEARNYMLELPAKIRALEDNLNYYQNEVHLAIANNPFR